MKILLVAEYREGVLRSEYTQLIAFAQQQQAQAAMFLVGAPAQLPQFSGTLYLADVAKYVHRDQQQDHDHKQGD